MSSFAFSFTPAPSSSSSSTYSPFSSSKTNPPFFASFSSSSSSSFSLRLASPPSFSSFSFGINRRTDPAFVLHSTVEVAGGGGDHGSIGGGHGGGGHGGDDDGNAGEHGRKKEAMMVLAEAGRSLESVPSDLAAAIKDGKIPASVVSRFLELEKNPFFRWLLQFGGFKERLLADDLFLAKVGMECGVGIFTKTAAEYDRRREKFFDELEIVFADVVMAILADFMLVYLPAPTVSLRPPLAINAGPIAKFFHNCPDNAFQVALSGTSYSLLQRFGAIARNGAKLFAVGSASSLVGTAVTNALINAKKAVDKSSSGEIENVPILSTSAAYGVYMGVSSNLRYQVLAGIIEQRILEPLLHQHKLMLSALCFAVRTGNTYLGSLLWVDYARFIGVQ
ncbi:protein RETICULATA-RELATED 4, chloroplastic [Arachis duranensis]|uniref:Protein RETICULATA-RELATED 4, chloroplastic n=1 Tax=Arachis duranensis TaxID=130453 RepID=A0A6P4CLD9_ARADU|nr:protein RETICULATA-RELATED 4, chloroplastic [Arachis duranensis]